MKKLLTLLLLAGFVTGVVCDSASAQKKKKKRDPDAAFKRMDKDKDGKLSLEEFKGKRKGKALERAEKQFKQKDKNNDGFLSLEEFKARKKKKKKNE